MLGAHWGTHDDKHGFYYKQQAKLLEGTKQGSNVSSVRLPEIHPSCLWGWTMEGARKKTLVGPSPRWQGEHSMS